MKGSLNHGFVLFLDNKKIVIQNCLRVVLKERVTSYLRGKNNL